MPGITANLTNAAFAIWEEIPRKTRRPVNSMGGPMEQGRSAWISSVIIEHHQAMKAFKLEVHSLTEEKLSLMEKLRIMTECRDALQAHVLAGCCEEHVLGVGE